MPADSPFSNMSRGELMNLANAFAAAFAERGLIGGEQTRSVTRPNKDRVVIDKKNATAKNKKIIAEQDKLAKSLAELTDSTEDTDSVFVKLTDTAKSTALSFFSVKSSMALATKSYVQGVNDFRSSMKYGTDVSTGLFDNMRAAMSMGIDPSILSELGAATRQAQNAMGGAAIWADQLSNAQKTLFKQIGNLEDAAQFTSAGMMTLGMAGIVPTTKMFVDNQGSLTKLGIQFNEIRKITGATFVETSALMRDFVENEAIRFKLVGKTSQIERKAILQEVMARHASFAALGLTTEQATRAAQALDSMAGKGPMERFKKAAQLQMAASAMGMASQGAQLATLERLGRRRSPEQDEKYLKIMGQMNAKIAESQTGSFAQEIFTSSITQRAGLDDMLGESSPFITTLGEALQIDKAQLAQIKTIADGSTTATKLAAETTYWTSIIASNIAHNPLISAATAILSGIGATVIGIFTILKARSIAAAAGAGAGAAAGAGKQPKGVKKPGMLKSGGRFLLRSVPIVAAALAAEAAVKQATQAITTGESDVSNFLNEKMPNVMVGLGDIIGRGVDAIGSVLGNEASMRRMLLNDEKSAQIAAMNIRQRDVDAVRQHTAKIKESTKNIQMPEKTPSITNAKMVQSLGAIKIEPLRETPEKTPSITNAQMMQSLSAIKIEQLRRTTEHDSNQLTSSKLETMLVKNTDNNRNAISNTLKKLTIAPISKLPGYDASVKFDNKTNVSDSQNNTKSRSVKNSGSVVVELPTGDGDMLTKVINDSKLTSGVGTTNGLLNRMVELSTAVQRSLNEVSVNSERTANVLSRINNGGGFKGGIPGTS